jgi:hypothetical protein
MYKVILNNIPQRIWLKYDSVLYTSIGLRTTVKLITDRVFSGASNENIMNNNEGDADS